MKKDDNKRKKEKLDNLDDKNNSCKNTREREGELCVTALGMIKKKWVRKNDKKRKMVKLLKALYERSNIFNNVQMCVMTDPCILMKPAFRLIEEDFKCAVQEGPTYICDICWRLEFRRNVTEVSN